MLVTRASPAKNLIKSRSVINLSFKRFLNAPPAAERVPVAEVRDAFLEPVLDRPGVTYLSLNRPKSKNAVCVVSGLYKALNVLTLARYRFEC